MKIAIIGCGNIGKIYARSFVKYKIVEQNNLLLVDKDLSRVERLKSEYGGKITDINDPSIALCEIVILAVKPQDFSSLSTSLNRLVSNQQIILSIMAGITIERIQLELNCCAVVRAMPNSPIQLGMGMTGFCASTEITKQQIQLVEQVLSTTGRTVYFEDEKKMDAVTALSGSGPAYVFYFIQSMISAGEKLGFTPSESNLLVNQTILGAYHLMNASSSSLDELIKTVASKGGTTEAALEIFKEQKFRESLINGILAAEKRGKDLAITK